MSFNKSIEIDYYSDVLCIWAYISQVRIEQLGEEFKSQIKLNSYYFDIFGDVENKLKNKGGVTVYAEHIQEVVSSFEHLQVHADVWLKNTPTTCIAAHVLLAAVSNLCTKQVLPQNAVNMLASRLRTWFFLDAKDISNQMVLNGVIESLAWPHQLIKQEIHSGAAYAKHASSLTLAHQQQVHVSPTLLFNNNRQRLAGNVGYRVIQANVKELLSNAELAPSWC